MIDLSLYLVTDRASGVADVVRAAVDGGVTVVQLRDPDASGRELYESAGELRNLLRGRGVPLIVNDRVDVALAAGADGVHVGQSDLPAEAARAMAPDLIIGWSVSTVDEVAAANGMPVDYLGIGPVRATPTKPDAGQPLGIAGVHELRTMTDKPCVAIGGIDAGNAAAVIGTGVDGICVVSAICGATDPQVAASELRKAIGR